MVALLREVELRFFIFCGSNVCDVDNAVVNNCL